MMLPVRVQHARVLPSNAPPLHDDNGLSSQTLREHSGNSQHQAEFDNGQEQKPFPDAVENWTQLPRQIFNPQQYARAWTYGNQRNPHHYHGTTQDAEDEENITRVSKVLSKRFWQSDKFRKYRARQPKAGKALKEQMWPDHLEEALFRALVKYPPRGRRQELLKGKQSGRNESIAEEIRILTGITRTRKEVSSHIQVLKPFVEHDPVIMRYLTKQEPRQGAQRQPSTGRRASSLYHINTSPLSSQPGHAPRGLMIPTMSDFAAMMKHKENLTIFEPADFQMFVQQKQHDNIRRLHTYTQSIENALGPDILVSDWASLHQEYPLLARIHANKRLDCNVLVANSSLAFPLEPYKDLPGVELGIQLQFHSQHLTPNVPLRCHNSFYRNGEAFLDQSDPASNVQINAVEDERGCEASVKFGSNFWAKHLGYLAQKLKEAAGVKENKSEEEVAAYLEGIIALQQIAMPNEHARFERILVIMWTFRQSSAPRGRTSWRKLILPPDPGAVISRYPEPGMVKPERVDSVYSHANSLPFGEVVASNTTTPSHLIPPLTLQSPFRYESSAEDSSPASPTWTPSTSFGNPNHPQPVDWAADNTYDVHCGDAVNTAFNPFLNLSNFDSAAFNNDFDTSAGEFPADTQLEQYPQPWADTRYAIPVAEGAYESAHHVPPLFAAIGHGDVVRMYDPRQIAPPIAPMDDHKPVHETYSPNPYGHVPPPHDPQLLALPDTDAYLQQAPRYDGHEQALCLSEHHGLSHAQSHLYASDAEYHFLAGHARQQHQQQPYQSQASEPSSRNAESAINATAYEHASQPGLTTPYSLAQDQVPSTHEQQAYGGAGQVERKQSSTTTDDEAGGEEEREEAGGALATLADASFLATRNS